MKFLKQFIDIDQVTLSLIGVLLVITGTLFFIAWVLEAKNKKLNKGKPVNREKITRVYAFKDWEEPENHDFSYPVKNIDKDYDDENLFV